MGHERARTLLKESGVDVLIWGIVIKQGGKSVVPKLYWTPARDIAATPSFGRYEAAEGLRLPQVFWQELTKVLGLLVANSNAAFMAQEGHYQADQLDPFIVRVRALLEGSNAEQWNAATRAQVLTILASALTTYGEQSGSDEALVEAIDDYGRALEGYPREKVPLDWATTQNNLANALESLGERQADTALLQVAVTDYQEALMVFTPEKVPLKWATSQNNLGIALRALGEHQLDPTLLQDAVTAYQRALKVFTREKAPLKWATTQNNLGTALGALGERQSDPARLQDAARAFEAALDVFRAEKADYYTLATEANLQRAQEEISLVKNLKSEVGEKNP